MLFFSQYVAENEDFLHSVYDDAHRLALRWTQNEADADDAVNTAFAKLLASRTKRYTRREWRRRVFRATRNAATDTHRRKAVFAKHREGIAIRHKRRRQNQALDRRDSEDDEDLSLKKSLIRRLVSSLPAHEAHVIELRYLEKFSTRAITKRLRIEEGLVRLRLHRGLTRLEKECRRHRDLFC